jgi:PadR family transcriptional regulator PadR
MVRMQHTCTMTTEETGGATEHTAQSPPKARLHGDMLTTTLLAFLKASNAYGYELTQRLTEAGLPPFDSGAVYRTLRQLEATGLVSSFWDTSESGPARRVYSLTEAGELFLASWMKVMETYQAVLDQTLGLAARGWAPPGDETTRR